MYIYILFLSFIDCTCKQRFINQIIIIIIVITSLLIASIAIVVLIL
jgi:hypothetical protein